MYQIFPNKAAAKMQVVSINKHFLENRLPATKGSKCQNEDPTQRYCELLFFSDGTYGHIIDDYILSLKDKTITDKRHMVSLNNIQDGPKQLERSIFSDELVEVVKYEKLIRDSDDFTKGPIKTSIDFIKGLFK